MLTPLLDRLLAFVSLLVAELRDQLKSMRELWSMLNFEQGFPGNVVLEVNRRVPARSS
jgi:hypothetical protein